MRNDTSTREAHLLSVEGLTKEFPVRMNLLEAGARRLKGLRPRVNRAVSEVSLHLDCAETLGVVGESGCGKTTLGRTILRLTDATAGSIRFQDQDITSLPAPELRRIRPQMQIVFQDPTSSLNPRKRVDQIIGRALRVAGVPASEQRGERLRILEAVGLEPELVGRYPHQLSGGQRQRVCIGRAIATRPGLIVADEPVSSLDVSVQAQILSLLKSLQAEQGLAMLFISHDVSVVRQVSHRMAVMFAGHIVETGPTAAIVSRARHPYTLDLLAAIPRLHGGTLLVERAREATASSVRGEGCPYAERCRSAHDERCSTQLPSLREVAPGHLVACHEAGSVPDP